MSEKNILSPLITTYCVAILTKNHIDREFLSWDDHIGEYVWVRKYRLAVMFMDITKALQAVADISAGGHPDLDKEGNGLDLKTITVLETSVIFSPTQIAR